MSDGAAESTTESVVSGYSGRVFVAIAVGWVGLRLGSGVLPPLLPTIIDDLAITPFLAGLALTAMTAINAVCQFLGGRFADAWSRKTALAASLAALVAGFAALTGAVTYPLFVLGAMILGVGGGLFFVPMRAALADLFVERRGRAFGINESIGSAASVAAAGLAVVVVWLGAWRAAFLPGLVVAVAGAVLLHRWHREPYRVEGIDLQVRATVRRLLGIPEIRYLLVSYSLVTFTMRGAFSFLPAFLEAEKGFSPELASGSYALISATAVVGMSVAGTLSDRFDRRALAGVVVLTGSVGLAGIVVGSSLPFIGVSIVVFAGGLMGFPPVMQAYLMEGFPDETMARDFGGFKTVYAGVGSLGATYVGYVEGVASYSTAFAGLIACLLASAAVILWVTHNGES